MTAYYNERDPFAAQWLRNLIRGGHIAPGEVDERSITEIHADDLRGFAQCHFFAGIGGWSLALRRAGWADDIPVWTGSCPCQPFSAASHTWGRAGFADERHLWPDFFALIAERSPAIVFGEQVDNTLGRVWLDLVADDLEAAGYAFASASLGASSGRLPMDGPRLYWVSALPSLRLREAGPGASLPARGNGQEWPRGAQDLQAVFDAPMQPGECHPQPIIRLDHDGLPPGVVKARTNCAGNAIVPEVARHFIGAVVDHFAPARSAAA
jgi:DNA (cytosine-5)-methyltransferase 1